MFGSQPGPGELVCQFGQSVRGSRFWCFAWFLWLLHQLVWLVRVVGVVGHAEFDFMVWSHPGPDVDMHGYRMYHMCVWNGFASQPTS